MRFEIPIEGQMMAIDGTWRRNCHVLSTKLLTPIDRQMPGTIRTTRGEGAGDCVSWASASETASYGVILRSYNPDGTLRQDDRDDDVAQISLAGKAVWLCVAI